MNLLNFHALIITIVILGLIIIFVNNNFSYVELGFIGFGIFLIITSIMNYSEKQLMFNREPTVSGY